MRGERETLIVRESFIFRLETKRKKIHVQNIRETKRERERKKRVNHDKKKDLTKKQREPFKKREGKKEGRSREKKRKESERRERREEEKELYRNLQSLCVICKYQDTCEPNGKKCIERSKT